MSLRRGAMFAVSFYAGLGTMAFEMVLGRALVPYFGGTIYTWGALIAVFAIMHFVPGGPVERQIMQFQMAMADRGGTSMRGGVEIPQEAIEEIQRYYGFDKPVHIRYVQWLWLPATSVARGANRRHESGVTDPPL